MADNKTEEGPAVSRSIPAETSDSGEDQPVSASTAAKEETKKEEPDTVRESKRRKNCPKALDKFEELMPSNPTFSFSFDTKLTATPEFTPKFGSFNLVVATPDKDLCRQIPVEGVAEEVSKRDGDEVSGD